MWLRLSCAFAAVLLVAGVAAFAEQATRPAAIDTDFKRLLGDCARCHEAQCGTVDDAVQAGWIKPGDPEGSQLYKQLLDSSAWSPQMKVAIKLSDETKKSICDYIKNLKASDVVVSPKRTTASTMPKPVVHSTNLEVDFARVITACSQCHKIRHQSVDISYQAGRIVPGDPEASRIYRQISHNHMRGATHLTDYDTQVVFDYITSLKPAETAATQPSQTATTASATPLGPAPPFHLRIHCGAGKDYKGGNYTDPDGNVWLADRKYVKGDWGFVGGGAHWHPAGNPELIQDTNKMEPLFRSERSDLDRYCITVPGNGKYTVKLYFCENFDQVASPGQRVFSIWISGKEVIKNLDVYKEVGSYVALIKTVQAEVTNGVMSIDFKNQQSQWGPMIDAIEVISEQSK